MNLSLNALRRQKSRLRVFQDTVPSEQIVQTEAIEDTWENNELIEWALQRLDPDQRAVVVMRLIEGYSVEETSEILKVPMGTVASRLSRAQKKLKTILKPHIF